MKTLVLKLPQILEAQLEIFARKQGLSRSEIIRRALLDYFSNNDGSKAASFLDLARDLVGSIDGTPDLSTNKVHFEGYGK